MRRVAALSVLATHRLCRRLKDKLTMLVLGPAFQRFGRNSVLQTPVRLFGESRISIGAEVFIGSNSWLQTLENGQDRGQIEIRDGTSIAGFCVISAGAQIILEEDVLLARNVYISDHSHRFSEKGTPIRLQGIDRVAPVIVGRGAWLGQNSVICPGVRVGEGAVVGANSVVKSDIPDYSIAVGAPARVVGTIGAQTAPGLMINADGGAPS